MVLTSAYTFKRNEGGNIRKDLPDQAPILSFFTRPIANSHQMIDEINCVKSTTDVYSAYNNEKTRLNFGIFYTVIKSRWSNISLQWNNDKIFNIVGHYAAAKQNFITVTATEIDYEDINKSPNNSSSLSNFTSSNPQSEIINRFYDSLTSDKSLTTSITTKSENDVSSATTFETSYSSTPMQQAASNSTTPTTSTSIQSMPLQNNSFYTSQPQFYQPNSSTFLSHSQFMNHPHPTYFNPMQTSYNQQQSIQPMANDNNAIMIEDVSTQQTKDSSQRKRKKSDISKNKISQSKTIPSRNVRTRSDAKNNQNSQPTGVMNLAVTSLSLQKTQSDEEE